MVEAAQEFVAVLPAETEAQLAKIVAAAGSC